MSSTMPTCSARHTLRERPIRRGSRPSRVRLLDEGLLIDRAHLLIQPVAVLTVVQRRSISGAWPALPPCRQQSAGGARSFGSHRQHPKPMTHISLLPRSLVYSRSNLGETSAMDRFNLGSYRRRISTVAAETQRWFDIGLNWCYGFNHEEGIKCFERALETDATCPMVHWGIAYAAGPFYNLTWKVSMTRLRCSARRNAASSICRSRKRMRTAPPKSNWQLIAALASALSKVSSCAARGV